jgi:tRNA(Ile)-lysidine synthase
VGDGLEAAARESRYRFLQSTAERLGARYVVTAHTADDQAETVLHHLLRGTGLAGLAGISRARPLGPAVTLLRPMLCLRRQDVTAYLNDLGQTYRQDATNAQLDYTRNRIRHELLPSLAANYNPQVVEAISRLAMLAGDAQAVIERDAHELAERAVRASKPATVEVDLSKLRGSPRHLVRELLVAIWRSRGWPLQSMGYAEWESLAAMAVEPAKQLSQRKRVFPGEITVERHGEALCLTRPFESGPTRRV